MIINNKLLVLVDKNDKIIGYKSKAACHRGAGILHRAFSLLVFNSSGKLLLQKRSRYKNLWPLYWSNTCCSHPIKGRNLKSSAEIRLQEELGFTCPLTYLGKVEYQASFANVGSEQEITHLLYGYYDRKVIPNKTEVRAIKWIEVKLLVRQIAEKPDRFTPFLKAIMKKFGLKLENIAKQPADNPEEIFELVDGKGKVIGKVKRADAHKNPSLRHKAVHLIIFDTKGRILLQKRSRFKDLNPFFWTVSVGGHVDLGESYKNAAIREAKEELAIKLKPQKIKLLGKNLTSNLNESELIEVYSTVYKGRMEPNLKEIEKVEWFEQKKLLDKIKNNKIRLTPNAQATLTHKKLSRQIFWQIK